MTPAQFIATGQRLYGRKKWKAYLARDLGIDVSTVHRMVKRAQIPGAYEIALKAMLANHQARVKLEKAARKLLPRKFRKRSPKNVAKRKAVKARRPLGARHPQPGADRPDETPAVEGKDEGVC
jgi:hypothetical protein